VNRFKWYRKWRGGYWVYEHFLGWYSISKDKYDDTLKDRECMLDNRLEDWTVVKSITCACGEKKSCSLVIDVYSDGSFGRSSENWLSCGNIRSNIRKYKNSGVNNDV